jgi:hypothetical protein
MCTLEAYLQCYDRFFEVFSNEVELNELMLENIFSQLLIEFFEEVMVEVYISFPNHEELAMKHCVIHVHAQCHHRIYTAIPDTDDNFEVRIEHKMCSILRELFCSVIVDSVTLFPSPRGRTFAQSRVGKNKEYNRPHSS